MRFLYLTFVTTILLTPSTVLGQLSEKLFITEVMWDSIHPGADDFDNGGHANGDWWELLNASDEPIDMTGFLWDDDDQLFGNDYTIFPEFVIQPKELIIILREEETSAEHEDGFRYAWNIPAGMRVLSETAFADTGSGDTFSGLSGGGDEINLYDAEGDLIQSLVLEAATTGFSKTWGFVDGTYTELGLAKDGVDGAVESRTDGSTLRLTDPNYTPDFLDVSSAGHVEGFDIFVPRTEVSLDALCTEVSQGATSFDAFEAARTAAGVLPGDTDENGNVDFADFLTLSGNFGKSGTHSAGDFDCSGTVEFADFLTLSANFGLSSEVATSVPEPSTGLSLVMGLLGLHFRRRRRPIASTLRLHI